MSYKPIYCFTFLPMIIYLGLTTSYEDFLFSKIKNKWVLTGLLYTFILYILSWILHSLLLMKMIHPAMGRITFYLNWNFDKWCINLIISSVVAYLLWYFKLWAAGDAKLFICYSALIPMGQYSKVYFNYYFASFLLFLTIFIPSAVYLIIKASVVLITDLVKRKDVYWQKSVTLIRNNRTALPKIILGYAAIFLSMRIIKERTGGLIALILPNEKLLFLISLFAYKPLSRLFKKNVKILLVICIGLIIYLGYKMLYSQAELVREILGIFKMSFGIMFFAEISKQLINLYVERTEKKTTPFAIWMFLGVLIVWFM